jgi:regulator of replication initiation timing
MIKILEVLNRELEEREKRAMEFYRKYNDLRKDLDKLMIENDMLRKDLKELSKEHFKK